MVEGLVWDGLGVVWMRTCAENDGQLCRVTCAAKLHSEGLSGFRLGLGFTGLKVRLKVGLRYVQARFRAGLG